MENIIALFISFIKIGLFSIGGGYAAMPLIQSEILQAHNWLTLNEFHDLVTIAEMTPGSIAINGATFVGYKIAGLAGAITATFAVILPSIILLSILSFLYYRYRQMPFVQNILLSLRPVIVALIFSVAINMFKSSIIDAGGILTIISLLLLILSFFALRKLKWSPILVMVLCGIIYTIIKLGLLI